MRDLTELERYRRRSRLVLVHYGWLGDAGNGVFTLPSPRSGHIQCVASNGHGWDHVSVSMANRCPNWPEMEHVKRLFFKDDVMLGGVIIGPEDIQDQSPIPPPPNGQGTRGNWLGNILANALAFGPCDKPAKPPALPTSTNYSSKNAYLNPLAVQERNLY